MLTEPSPTFSGSYDAADVQFLLRPLELTPTAVEERERHIQSGSRHYSEMIGPEDAPTRSRVRLFRECMEMNAARFAQDLVTLAAMLRQSVSAEGELTLVSIARAGTPVGVVLQRLISKTPGWAQRVRHYSISAIRDRGIDWHALRTILSHHPAESIRFLDGWTGKGTIANELAQSLQGRDEFRGIDPALWVPLDISAAAGYAANTEDYLLPSSLLGGTISGLVSRSVLPKSDIGTAQYHGCVQLQHLRRYDLSRWFVAQMEKLAAGCAPKIPPAQESQKAAERFQRSQAFVDELAHEFRLPDRHRVKIGIGETVRVALRRMPERILLRDSDSADGAFIRRLADFRAIPVEHRCEMPHAAVGIIAGVLAQE